MCFRGERVLLRAAGAVQPPDLPALATRGGQLVEHGQHRGHADAGREQQHRPVVVLVEDEVAARRGDFEVGSRLQHRVQVAGDEAV